MSVSHIGMERLTPAFNMFLSGNKFPVVPPQSLDSNANGSAECQFLSVADAYVQAANSGGDVKAQLALVAQQYPEAAAGLDEVLATAAKQVGAERLVPTGLLKAADAIPLPQFAGVAGLNVNALNADGSVSPNSVAGIAIDTTPGENGIIFMVDPNGEKVELQ